MDNKLGDKEKSSPETVFDTAGPSKNPSVPHITIDLPEDDAKQPSEPPPAFTTYNAEFSTSDDGDILSHDHHLNVDGEALNQFILSHAKTPPTYVVSLRGSHTERRTRVVQRKVNGQYRQTVETYTVTIVDFEFSIDLTNTIVLGPEHYSYPDSDACYRGLMVRQVVDSIDTRRKATDEEIKAFKTAKYARIANGFAPWCDAEGAPRGGNHNASTKTLRDWADEYAASPKLLKEFVYEKYVYGWNQAKLTTALERLIERTGYSGSINVSFSVTGNKVVIRPDNRLSRTLSSLSWKVILIIFLVYPFIWLFKRFSSRGGGRWEVVGGAYAVCVKEKVGDGDVGNEVDKLGVAPRDDGTLGMEARLVENEDGEVIKVTGLREGEWFKRWENKIRRCVVGGVRQVEPFRDALSAIIPAEDTQDLDGY